LWRLFRLGRAFVDKLGARRKKAEEFLTAVNNSVAVPS
jgi:hypothetical protein